MFPMQTKSTRIMPVILSVERVVNPAPYPGARNDPIRLRVSRPPKVVGRERSPAPSVYLMVKDQDLEPTLPAASFATTLTVFLPVESFGELYESRSVEAL